MREVFVVSRLTEERPSYQDCVTVPVCVFTFELDAFQYVEKMQSEDAEYYVDLVIIDPED